MEVVWLVDFDAPTASVPFEQLGRLGQGGGRAVGQQAPVERFDPVGRGGFSRPQRGDRHRFGPLRRQDDPFGPHRQHHRPARSVRPGREGERDLAQQRSLNQPAPQLVALGQAAVVGGPNQPVDARFSLRPDHELVNVAFPVGDVDQAGVGQGLRQFGAARKAFQPAHALLGLDRPMPLVFAEGRPVARPHPGIQHPQRHPVRRDRQRRVDVQPVLPQIAQRPQPGNARLVGVIQFRAVLHAQHHRLATHPLDAAIPVRRQHRLPIDSLVRQQPIRALGFCPTAASHRNAGAGLRPQTFRHPYQPSVQPRIPQVRPAQLRRRPTRRRRFHHPFASCCLISPFRCGQQSLGSRCVESTAF